MYRCMYTHFEVDVLMHSFLVAVYKTDKCQVCLSAKNGMYISDIQESATQSFGSLCHSFAHSLQGTTMTKIMFHFWHIMSLILYKRTSMCQFCSLCHLFSTGNYSMTDSATLGSLELGLGQRMSNVMSQKCYPKCAILASKHSIVVNEKQEWTILNQVVHKQEQQVQHTNYKQIEKDYLET